MIGPLSTNTYNLIKPIVRAILRHPTFAKDILAAKQKWHQIEEQDRLSGIVQKDNYYAKRFGIEAEELFRQIGSLYGFQSLKEILIDENHNKDLSMGDFVLRLYNGRGSIFIDTKFCYTVIPGCYGGFSLNNEQSFAGWNLCFSTNCDSAILIYAEYVRELVDTGKLEKLSGYRYKDYKHIMDEAIANGYAFKINK